jgi:hypothetical protein
MNSTGVGVSNYASAFNTDLIKRIIMYIAIELVHNEGSKKLLPADEATGWTQ